MLRALLARSARAPERGELVAAPRSAPETRHLDLPVFERALIRTLEREGVEFTDRGQPIAGRTGHANDPDDPGGETNYGITAEVARAHGYQGDMAGIPYDRVKGIYRSAYWDRVRGDEVPDEDIAEELFDTGVNCGVAVAVRFLQETLNLLNNEGKRYEDIDEDGRMGPGTLAALKKALAHAPWYKPVILMSQNSFQVVRYRDLCRARPRLEKYYPGWVLNRGMMISINPRAM